MTTLDEIKEAVARLDGEQFSRFRQWFIERDADAWEQEMGEDIQAGKLDFLAEEGLLDFQAGKVHKL
jgi:hypothetical protein